MRHHIIETMLLATENKNVSQDNRPNPIQQRNITINIKVRMFQITSLSPGIMLRQGNLPTINKKLVLMQSTSNRIKTSLSHV